MVAHRPGAREPGPARRRSAAPALLDVRSRRGAPPVEDDTRAVRQRSSIPGRPPGPCPGERATTSQSPNRPAAAVHTLVGLAGLLVTAGVPFASQEGAPLLGFEVNPLHNIVHLAVGLALLLGSRTVAGARAANLWSARPTCSARLVLLAVGGLAVAAATGDGLAATGASTHAALHGLHLGHG